jgi:hypothetical protein
MDVSFAPLLLQPSIFGQSYALRWRLDVKPAVDARLREYFLEVGLFR